MPVVKQNQVSVRDYAACRFFMIYQLNEIKDFRLYIYFKDNLSFTGSEKNC